MSQAENARLENLMNRLESEIARNARRVQRRALWEAARYYLRSRSWLEDLLPPDILSLALHDVTSPSTTWQVLRHLCHHIRFNARSELGSPQRLRRCRIMAAGELLLLSRQRAAERDRNFVGEVLRGISQSM